MGTLRALADLPEEVDAKAEVGNGEKQDDDRLEKVVGQRHGVARAGLGGDVADLAGQRDGLGDGEEDDDEYDEEERHRGVDAEINLPDRAALARVDLEPL